MPLAQIFTLVKPVNTCLSEIRLLYYERFARCTAALLALSNLKVTFPNNKILWQHATVFMLLHSTA